MSTKQPLISASDDKDESNQKQTNQLDILPSKDDQKKDDQKNDLEDAVKFNGQTPEEKEKDKFSFIKRVYAIYAA